MNANNADQSTTFVRRLQVRGFRSLANCDVCLGPLTVLVGFNASGKSNVLDALRFVADALWTSPEEATARRGGLDALLHHSASGRAEAFLIGLELGLPVDDSTGQRVQASYSLQIGPDPAGKLALAVLSEDWTIRPDHESHFSLNRDGALTSRLRLPVRSTENLALAELESALRSMEFYDLNTASLRALDESTTKQSFLGSSGAHLGQVLGVLGREDPQGKERLDDYLSALVPGAVGIDELREGRYSTVEARFRSKGDAWSTAPAEIRVFPRESLSEGTLRASGVLAALLQVPANDGRISLIGMEEPETALHPANVGSLYEALDDAVQHTQVIVTSQSSALLDSEYVDIDHLRVVENIDGATVIGEIDAAGSEIVDQGLMTISQLHASGQMRPSTPLDPGSAA
jgi:predicted ATPase